VVSLFVPSLTGGVSRQPATQRQQNQLEAADDCSMILSRGCEKRPGIECIDGQESDLSLDVATPAADPFVHWVDRDDTRRWLVLIDEGEADADLVQVFDILTGNKKTVEFEATNAAACKAYLRAGSVSKDVLAAVSIADAVFILNKSVTVAFENSARDYQYSGTAVRNTANGHNKATAADFDRPPSASGEYWYARGDSVGYPAGFYISQNHTGVGPWYRRVATEMNPSALDNSTMPIRMQYDATLDKFVIYQIAWTARYSGDDVSNPGPSFAGRKITDISFHRDRLWALAEEQVVASESGSFYNYYLNNAFNIVDADTIDVSLSEQKITNGWALVGFDKALILLTAGKRQFEVRSEGPLTPFSVNVVPSTSYDARPYCRPVTMGSQLYFVSERASATQVYEYAYRFESAGNVADDITAHCSGYVPLRTTLMSASENNDLLILSVTDEPTRLYLYQTYWYGDEKVQSAWFRWNIGEDAEIMSHRVFDNWLYMLVRRSSKVWLERIDLTVPANDKEDPDEADEMPFHVHLDRKRLLTGVYDAGTDTTTWTLPYSDPLATDVVLSHQWGSATGRWITVTTEEVGGVTELSIRGDYSDYPVWVGRPYTKRVQLSEQFFRDSDGKALTGVLQLKRAAVYYRNSGFFEIGVTPTGRETATHRFVAFRLGGITGLLGRVNIEDSGVYHFRPLCSSKGTTIEITNNSPFPSGITNIEFVASFVPKKASPTK
jgi:hypothetical protein